ncbi:hypothetical protein NPX98_06035, partial [Bartonella sp. A5(2022)]|nr:hypothetical protein [Bartonella sp. A05]
MVRILKSHVCLCVLTTAIFHFSQNAYSNIKSYAWSPALCDVCDESEEPESLYQKGLYGGETHVIKGHFYNFYTRDKLPVRVEDIQDSVSLPSIVANSGSIFNVMDTVVQATGTSIHTNPIAISSESGASVLLNNTKINTDGERVALSSSSGAKITMIGGSITAVDSGVLSIGETSYITLDNVTINSNHKNTVSGKNTHRVNDSVFNISQGSTLDLNKVVVKSINSHGFRSGNSSNTFTDKNQPVYISKDDLYLNTVDVEDSIITIWGNKSYGIFFEEKAANEQKKNPFKQGNFRFSKTKIDVPDSTAIYTNAKGYPAFFFLTDTNISGNLLLQVKNGATVKVTAEGSSLTGGVRVHDKEIVDFSLMNGSKWTLTTKKQKDLQDTDWGIDSHNSFISSVRLSDSDIVFDKPVRGGYQTLSIGSKGSSNAYIAEGKAQVYLNTYLNDGGSLVNQVTDRLLIHGNVVGSTTVHISPVKGSPGGSTGSGRNDQGISIVQVSGNAKQDSFKLNGGYVALDNLPYQYRLYAYGPDSIRGKANTAQRLVKGTGDFWDFRLESRYIQSPSIPNLVSDNHDLEAKISSSNPHMNSFSIISMAKPETSVAIFSHSAVADLSSVSGETNLEHMVYDSSSHPNSVPTALVTGLSGTSSNLSS